MSFRLVIPARFASTRLPAKPLADLGGRPMIARVVEQARRSQAESVVVAADHERVLAAARQAGAQAVMTRPDHASGSDRVMEVVANAGWSDDDIVVNVQGDEPLIPPAVIDQVAALARRASAWPERPCEVATLCEPIGEWAEVFDPNVVKVVADDFGRALYFSRAPLPWRRADFPAGGVGLADDEAANRLPDGSPPGRGWQRHIGIYAYRVGALREFVRWGPGRLEQVEALEQLRLLEHGRGIAVAEAVAPVPGGVDTGADLQRVRAAWERRQR